MRDAWQSPPAPRPLAKLLSPHLQHRVALQQPVTHGTAPLGGWAGLSIELQQPLGGLCLACPAFPRDHHRLVPTLRAQCPVHSVGHREPGAEAGQELRGGGGAVTAGDGRSHAWCTLEDGGTRQDAGPGRPSQLRMRIPFRRRIERIAHGWEDWRSCS